MAKKFGKFLLFTAAVSSAVAAAYYFLQKKDSADTTPEDEDYDDFSEDLDAASGSSPNYVSLTPESSHDETSASQEQKEGFTPLSETVAQAAENVETAVEEFFDEEDPSDEEPPISDN